MKLKAVLAALCLFSLYTGHDQGKIKDDFEPVCKALDTLIYERTTVRGELKLRAVMKRGNSLDFYFTNSLSDLPWTADDYRWFCRELKERFPSEYRRYSLGRISSRGETLPALVTGEPGNDGRPSATTYRHKGNHSPGRPVVERLDGMMWPEGLDGRHIALWQSHGQYYEQSRGRWEWQRPCLFQTVEDLFTQSFVLPFLVPMLENAGAYVMLPRERDIQKHEIIVDNDPDFRSDTTFKADAAPANLRLSGQYSEEGEWADAGTGFADAKAIYTGADNPFTMGTARMIPCATLEEGTGAMAEARWTPSIPERGEYAVYVSYKTLPNSTDAAHYTVYHLGGKTEFSVNQKMGGGTWIYLGTFEFDAGTDGCVTLDNIISPVRKAASSGKLSRAAGRTGGPVVTADAVKIGGGYGNIARSVEGDSTSVAELSGMPRFTEGARYWLQWAGMDTTLFSQNGMKDDYKDDYMCRGDWVAYMSGGSRVNPDEDGRNIPFDLAFALHSDAGMTSCDSTVGTLAIYTLKSEFKRKLPSGEDRRTSREYASLVQSQIVRDIRHGYDTLWNRRFIWDRAYRESRTPTCPAMLCELLSHQNFADMKLGHDPGFKFTVSRAIYKGILKYLSNRYGCDYTVQPLPVNSFSATFVNGRLRLKWRETPDMLEPTARPEGFILQTRIDSEAFDSGKIIDARKTEDGTFWADIDFDPGHIYSFRITAFNSGGKSFPSETLSAGAPTLTWSGRKSVTDSCVLVVNNFNRVSGPAWFDYPEFAGFDSRLDSGVPYVRDISYTGQMYENRRNAPWISNDRPGFGASFNDCSGCIIAGNTFDYPAVHGRAILDAGYAFCSASAEAFSRDTTLTDGIWCMDLICGKQVTVTSKGLKKARFRVFPEELQTSIRRFTASGGNILVSGANIATDIWDRVYPVAVDSSFRAASADFAGNVLGYGFISNYAGKTGEVTEVPGQTGMPGLQGAAMKFNNVPDEHLYCVEAPDGIAPANGHAQSVLRYEDTRVSAGICADFGTYRTVCLGFPIEVLTEYDCIDRIIKSSLQYFAKSTCNEQQGI